MSALNSIEGALIPFHIYICMSYNMRRERTIVSPEYWVHIFSVDATTTSPYTLNVLYDECDNLAFAAHSWSNTFAICTRLRFGSNLHSKQTLTINYWSDKYRKTWQGNARQAIVVDINHYQQINSQIVFSHSTILVGGVRMVWREMPSKRLGWAGWKEVRIYSSIT